MKRVCVFAGSNLGTNAAYRINAQRLGEEIVRNGLDLVYGGPKFGLMGCMGDCNVFTRFDVDRR